MTHCRCAPFLPCDATPVIRVNWEPKSTWSHWLSSFRPAHQAPTLLPDAWKCSLPCSEAWLASHWDEALIFLSGIWPFSTPSASWHSKDTITFFIIYGNSKKNAKKKKVKWANVRIWKGISWIGDLTKKQCGIVRDSRNVNGIRETLTGYRIWLLPRKQNCTGYGIGKNDIESSLMEVRDALFSCKRSGKCAIRTPFSRPYIASMFYVCKKILRYF